MEQQIRTTFFCTNAGRYIGTYTVKNQHLDKMIQSSIQSSGPHSMWISINADTTLNYLVYYFKAHSHLGERKNCWGQGHCEKQKIKAAKKQKGEHITEKRLLKSRMKKAC